MQGTDFIAGVTGIKQGGVRFIVEPCVEAVAEYSNWHFPHSGEECPISVHRDKTFLRSDDLCDFLVKTGGQRQLTAFEGFELPVVN